MRIASFETEHFFARYEFETRWQLCNSDCETVSIAELLGMAGLSLEEFGEERLAYTPCEGDPELRAAICGLYRHVSPQEVVALASPIEGIFLLANALLEPGDEVVTLSPGYDALENVFAHVAGRDRIRRWPFHATARGWGLELDRLRNLLSSRTRLLVVNFPHNPTGHLPSPDFQAELAAIAEQRGLWLFSDEMYAGLVHPGTTPIPSAADVTRRAIVLSGLSKTHGLPGLRAGWLIVPDPELRAEILNWKFYTSICPPGPTTYLARAALRAESKLRSRNLQRIGKNLELAESFFAGRPELFTWRAPLAGSTALVEFRVPSVSALSRKLASEEGLLIQSARMLGGDDRHMRIGLGRTGFAEALDRFGAWLDREGVVSN